MAMLRDFFTRLADLIDTVVAPQASPLSNLDRAMQAAGAAHVAARRALAVAIAEEEREIRRREGFAEKLSDLEQRAIEALRAGRDDLAGQAAETIAAVETEITASEQASVRFAAEVALARREVEAQRRRLADLDRGRRLARVGAALNSAPREGVDAISAAETALAKLEADNHDARAIREELAPPTERLIEQMADAGFGAPVRVRAADVMERLRARAVSPALITITTTTPQH
jgi:phage shock protein A